MQQYIRKNAIIMQWQEQEANAIKLFSLRR